ncbi:hypothetical protein [Agromyces soli]|uniref:Uncharacterized protein n=1 Tax=Agromyces soli TaxID=659012 RepID=A0ABY4AZT7_9MICO|nr:hypothetical protein [Agromyces soli]UOE27276.1 hypothetical protein MTP13_05710 [Agromyces soli]
MTETAAVERRARRRADAGFLACLVGPLVVAVLLNAVIRPWLAAGIGGERRSSGSGVRSNDTWWRFDPATQAEHPLLTGFLETSDGAIAMLALGATVVLLLGRWAVRAVRARRAEREASAR